MIPALILALFSVAILGGAYFALRFACTLRPATWQCGCEKRAGQ